MGVPSPFPGIFIAAENVGLATQRSGLEVDDRLDTLAVLCRPVLECDANGLEDATLVSTTT